MASNVKLLGLYLGTACLTFTLGLGLGSLLTSAVRCTESSVADSPIRNIDFENFTYPAWPIFGTSKGTFTLCNGEFPAERDRDGGLVAIGLSGGATYYDVTGDGIEDAIIGFSEDNGGGTAIVYAAYIYALQQGRPIFLWGFEAGDRADGGLRSIYGQNGELVIELKGKDKVIGKDLYASDDTYKGACCPEVFTRTRYRWNGSRFVQTANSEVLPLAGAPDTVPFPADDHRFTGRASKKPEAR